MLIVAVIVVMMILPWMISALARNQLRQHQENSDNSVIYQRFDRITKIIFWPAAAALAVMILVK